MKQVTKRLLSMLLSLGLLGAAIFIYFNFTRSAYEEAERMKSERAGKEEFISKQEDTVRKALGVIGKFQSQEQFVTLANIALPTTPDIAGILAQLNGLAVNNRIGLTEFASNPPQIEKETRSKTKKTGIETVVKALGKVKVSIGFKSSYEAAKEFIEGVENNLRLFSVDSIGLEPAAKAADNIYEFNVELTAYYQSQ